MLRELIDYIKADLKGRNPVEQIMLIVTLPITLPLLMLVITVQWWLR